MSCAITLREQHPIRSGTSRFLSQGYFVVYRMVLVVYGVSYAVYWPVGQNAEIEKFFTYWTFNVTTAYFCVATISAVLCWRSMKQRETCLLGKTHHDELPRLSQEAPTSPSTSDVTVPPVPRWLRRLHLVLWNIACLATPVVFTIFWTALYKGGALGSVDIHAHGLVAFVMLMDQGLVADEFLLRHMIFTEVYGSLYFIFNVVWYFTAPQHDRLIYDILDWNANTVTALVYAFLAMCVLVPLFALVHRGVYRLRERIYAKRQNGTITTETATSSIESPPVGRLSCDEPSICPTNEEMV